jgi:RNA polymerase sigma-70 factor (ECF subfamily)
MSAAATIDADAVRAALSGDASGYAALYRRHAPSVRRAAHRVVIASAEEDVVQEAFLRAFERLGELRDADRFKPWVQRIADNVAMDWHRDRARVTPREAPDEQVVDESLGPDSLAELADLARRVRGAMRGLSSRDLTALAMVVYLGFGPAEVGAALGMTANAAAVMLHRARHRLRTALNERAAGAGAVATAAS